jgi:hypothetical protein
MTLSIFLAAAAFILFILAAFKVGDARVSLGWLGAACFALAVILGGVKF